jgi:hypothetical protein
MIALSQLGNISLYSPQRKEILTAATHNPDGIPGSSGFQIGENNFTADQLSLGAKVYGYQLKILEDREKNLKAYTLVDSGCRWWGSRSRGPLAPLAIHSDGGTHWSSVGPNTRRPLEFGCCWCSEVRIGHERWILMVGSSQRKVGSDSERRYLCVLSCVYISFNT